MAIPYKQYLRNERLPHIFCPGCGHGTALKAFIRAVHKLGYDKNKVVVVSGIGCASRIPGYVDFNTLHTTHGRALAFATGVKLANPELKVVILSGDGDAIAIGGNHFIHTCRRNIDMTLVVLNNYIYGMTGGQRSPTTPEERLASTAPYGNIDPPFDVVEMARASGATFVARSTEYHVAEMTNLIAQGMEHQGMSVIEIMTSCPTTYGRRNRYKTAVEMVLEKKEKALPLSRAESLSEEERAQHILTGVFPTQKRREYVELFQELCQRAKGER